MSRETIASAKSIATRHGARVSKNLAISRTCNRADLLIDYYKGPLGEGAR